jgi:hypothetical protein
MVNGARRYLVAAIAGALAYSSEAAIYSSFIVPRLPEWQSVPFYWWALQFSPVVLLLAAIAFFAPSARTVVGWSSAAFIPWEALWVVYAALLEKPVGHDLWVTDSSYWVSIALLYGLTIAFSLACFAAFSLARRLFSRQSSVPA